MEARLLSLELIDFKGVRNQKYKFNNNALVKGKNGSGKTTIADAFYWLLSDKNYALVSNPNIRPNEGRECTPTVILELDVNGHLVTVTKMQKCKYSKPDENGNRKVTLSNTYEVNSVEKTERDFKSYLEEIGFDFEKFLQLSHPDLFIRGMTEKKLRDQMRNILFSMATMSITDLDIARIANAADVAVFLQKGYKKEEIEAMQNATLRKIRENYGKDGEILRAKIAGLESAKVDIDVAELEIAKKAVANQIKENREKQDDVSKQFEDVQKITDGILELKFKLADMQKNANADLEKKRSEIASRYSNLQRKAGALKGKLSGIEMDIASCERDIERFTPKLDALRREWQTAKDSKFDESKGFCSLCKQPLSVDRVEALKRDFDKDKKDNLDSIEKMGNSYKDLINESKDRVSSLLKEKELVQSEYDEIQSLIRENLEEQSGLPENVDISEMDEYIDIIAQIEEKEKYMKSGNSVDQIRTQLRIEADELQDRYNSIIAEISKAANNVRIDEQISELYVKQSEYEQSKCCCEKILEQLKAISKKKNELLTEDVNRCFDIVRWQFFEYQKNGEYKEVCVPYIDGKRFGESTNTGREVLAKLDIVKGLQKFYGQHYPVFLDGAECLDLESKARIDMNCQLIMSSVNESELIVVEG